MFLFCSVDFEGLALQQIKEDGVNRMKILVANDQYIWERTIDIIVDEWFDFVLGWNKKDGIAVKFNNKKVKDGAVSI